MLLQELLKNVVDALDRSGIDYMVTGSVVSSLQGEPRSTHGIDVVVTIPPQAIAPFVDSFPRPGYSLSPDAAQEAIAQRTMFSLISSTGGYKVDFWLLTDDPFDRSRFSRKYIEPAFGMNIYISRPEDTILGKLRWSQMIGMSEKHFIDALRVYEVQNSSLDQGYIEKWAGKLGLEKEFQRMKEGARAV